LLTHYFLSRFARESQAENPGITENAKQMLQGHAWPGNVRELSNVLQKALIFNRGAPISSQELSQALQERPVRGNSEAAECDQALCQFAYHELTAHPQDHLFDNCMDHFAAILIREALNLTGGNRSQAAKLLGLSRPTLHARIEKYGIRLETSVKGAR
jgi:DNA-binding NtrC family response regulator